MITPVTVESIRNEDNVVDMTALETGGVGNKKKQTDLQKKEHKPESPVGSTVAVPDSDVGNKKKRTGPQKKEHKPESPVGSTVAVPDSDVSVGESEVDPEVPGPGAPDPPATVDN